MQLRSKVPTERKPERASRRRVAPLAQALTGASLGLAVLGSTLAGNSPVASAQQPTARAEIKDASGKVVGRATFVQAPDGVHVSGSFLGLPPGEHDVDLYAVGTCEAPGFSSAGRDADSAGQQRGLHHRQAAPAGDLPNLRVMANGAAAMSVVAKGVTLGAGPSSLFDSDGSALVIEAGPGDQMTDPAGNAGDRIACGVLVAAGGGQAPAARPQTGGSTIPVEPLAAAGGVLACIAFALRRTLRRR